MKYIKLILAYLAALITVTVLGTVFQTQFNLAALANLGVPIPPDVRLQATGYDLLGFPPSFTPIMAAGLLIAFIVAAVLVRWLPNWRGALYALAGATAVFTAIQTMNIIFEIAPVAATRGLFGFASLILAGAAAGWVYAVFAPKRETARDESAA